MHLISLRRKKSDPREEKSTGKGKSLVTVCRKEDRRAKQEFGEELHGIQQTQWNFLGITEAGSQKWISYLQAQDDHELKDNKNANKLKEFFE